MKERLTFDGIVKDVLAGDKDAYREIVEQCEVQVRVVLAAMLPDNFLIEDVSQEVFVTAYMKLEHYVRGTDFQAWIKEIARNYARNEMRKWLRLRRVKEEYRTDIEHLIAPVVDSCTEEMKEDALNALRECMGDLKSGARNVMEAFYLHGKSGREIARQCGKHEGWVRLVLFRAREAVGRCLASKGVISNVGR